VRNMESCDIRNLSKQRSVNRIFSADTKWKTAIQENEYCTLSLFDF